MPPFFSFHSCYAPFHSLSLNPLPTQKKRFLFFSLQDGQHHATTPELLGVTRDLLSEMEGGGGRGQGYIRHIYVTLDCTPIKRIERQERRHYTHDEMTPTPPLMPPYNRRNGSDDDDDDVSCLREFSRTSGNNDLRGGKKRERIECFMERRRLT
jgi:hypothetical protein